MSENACLSAAVVKRRRRRKGKRACNGVPCQWLRKEWQDMILGGLNCL